MPNKYAAMDDWTDEELALFKEGSPIPVNPEPHLHGLVGAPAKPRTKRLKVVAEGDSWFDYKVSADLIDCLKRFHGYRIKNYATPGDTLENMIYGTEINRAYQRVSPQIRIVLDRIEKEQADVFLFSGGGNDIAGDEFESFLHHADSKMGVLKEPFVHDTINISFKKYYEDLISKVLSVSPNTHIFAHGYGYARPTGRGAGILGIKFAGPWLLPALGKKAIDPNGEGEKAIETMIDLYNDMLLGLDQTHAQFHFVDLRNIIADDDWRDELHLKSSAFRLVSDQVDSAIRNVYPDH